MSGTQGSLQRVLASTACLGLSVVTLTVLADVLFYRQPSGWPLGAFVLLAGLVLYARPGPPARRGAMRLALLVLALAAGAAVYRGGALAPLLAVLGLAALAAARARAVSLHAADWLAATAQAPLRMLSAHFRDRRLLKRRRGAARRAAAAVPRTLAAWAVPVLLAGVFLVLFCLANPVIECGVERTLTALVDFLDWLRLPEFPRVIFWIVVAAALWGLWRARGSEPRPGGPPPVPADAHPPAPAPSLALRCLAIFNLLFAVETVADLLYLWGGRALPAGMTYASYAHRGAYPLLTTALLSAGLTLAFFRPGRPAERHPAARALVFAWLAQNVLLTFSAAWRLHLYVDVYSLTRLRVAAFVWMGLVGFGLLAIAWRIARRRENRRLLDVNAAALLAVLLACAWWPMDGFIARHNVRFCREAGGPGQPLDLRYLEDLGAEALPALRACARLGGANAAAAAAAADRLADALHAGLRNPRAWTWRRGALARAVADDTTRTPAAWREPGGPR